MHHRFVSISFGTSRKHRYNWMTKLPKSKGILVISDNVKAQYKKRIKEGYDKQQIAWSIENAFNDKFFAENNYKHLTIGYFSRANTLDLYGTEPILTKKDKEEWDW